MSKLLGLCVTLSVAVAAASPSAEAHWPGQPQHQMAYLGELPLEDGA
jgi:hypothetical protein